MLRSMSYEGALSLRELAAHGFESATPTAFRFQASAQSFGSVELMRVQARALGYRHQADDSMWASRLLCLFVRHGEIAFDAPGVTQSGALTIGRGHALLLPLWHAFSLHCTRVAQWSSVFIEARAVEPMLPRMLGRPIVLSRGSSFALATAAFGHALADSPSALSDVEKYAVNQLLLEMCGTLMLDSVGVGALPAGAASVRDRAQALIAQRHAEPGLSVEALASAVSVSTRSLQAAFAKAGTTVAAELRRQRARTAAALLADRAFDTLTVDSIAQQSGFGCAVSMRRALAEWRLPGPRELRRRAVEHSAHG